MFPSITLTWLLLQYCSKATWHLVSQDENRVSRDAIPDSREALLVPQNAILISQDEKIMSFRHESREISVVEPKGVNWVYCYSMKVGTNRPAGLGSKRLCFGCETTAIHCKYNFSARNVKSALFECETETGTYVMIRAVFRTQKMFSRQAKQTKPNYT